METAGGTDIRESEPQREDNCFCYWMRMNNRRKQLKSQELIIVSRERSSQSASAWDCILRTRTVTIARRSKSSVWALAPAKECLSFGNSFKVLSIGIKWLEFGEGRGNGPDRSPCRSLFVPWLKGRSFFACRPCSLLVLLARSNRVCAVIVLTSPCFPARPFRTVGAPHPFTGLRIGGLQNLVPSGLFRCLLSQQLDGPLVKTRRATHRKQLEFHRRSVLRKIDVILKNIWQWS
jgi:hypothetical protein